MVLRVGGENGETKKEEDEEGKKKKIGRKVRRKQRKTRVVCMERGEKKGKKMVKVCRPSWRESEIK